MIQIIKKLNIFKKGPAPYEAKGFRSGFVILFAVTISSILLAIALGVSSIALKEVKFGTSAKDTNNAFFAADMGVECALIHDKAEGSIFVNSSSPQMTCNGVSSITATENPTSFWTFVLSGTGEGDKSCARVTVDKRSSPTTTVISKGYNIGDASCASSNPNRIEREIKTSYVGGGLPPPIIGPTSHFTVDTGGTLDNGLVAYWKLDEATGTRLDAVGTNTLASNNAVGQAVGKQGNAGQFNVSASRYLSRASNSDLQTGDISFTVAAWVKADSLPTSVILSKRDSATVREWTLTYVSPSFRFSTFNAAGSSVGLVLASTPTPSTGTWYLLVAWRDKTSGTVNIQVNNGTIYSVVESAVPTSNNAGFKIGAFAEPASTFWDGAIDEVGFWKRTLTAQERADLYNAGTGNTYNP